MGRVGATGLTLALVAGVMLVAFVASADASYKDCGIHSTGISKKHIEAHRITCKAASKVARAYEHKAFGGGGYPQHGDVTKVGRFKCKFDGGKFRPGDVAYRCHR